MTKKKFWTILTLALLVSAIWVIGVLADTVYLPVIRRDPTPLATMTPTATMFPTVTLTPVYTPTATRDPILDMLRIDDIVNGDTDSDLNDEYILIINGSDDDINLEDWELRAGESQPATFYYFPRFTLDSDDSVKIWTKSGVDTLTNLYMDLSEPIWENDGDCAYLRTDQDELIQRFCYGSLERYNINP